MTEKASTTMEPTPDGPAGCAGAAAGKAGCCAHDSGMMCVDPEVYESMVSEMAQLALECDSRQAHERVLEAQVCSLGGVPIDSTFIDHPWPEPDMEEDGREADAEKETEVR